MTEWAVVETDRAKAERQKVADALVESHGQEFSDRIVYSVHDPAPGETEGLVQILRIVHVATEEAARFGAGSV